MEDVLKRLDRCFLAVFPDLPAAAVRRANVDETPGWDSTAMFTLISVVEEEFGVQFTENDIANLVSYPAFSSKVSAGSD